MERHVISINKLLIIALGPCSGSTLMPKNPNPVRVAVNVMRARLTVVGFNIAIVSFQLGQVYRVPGGVSLPGIEHGIHLVVDTTLFMALSLSIIALIALIMSSTLDDSGVCTHWSLVAGDLLMYLGLAYTISGFFELLGTSVAMLADKAPQGKAAFSHLYVALLITGGSGWFLAMYVGPAVTLMRSPFSHRINVSLGITYVMLLIVLAWVNSEAVRLETAGSPHERGVLLRILRELAQPFRW